MNLDAATKTIYDWTMVVFVAVLMAGVVLRFAIWTFWGVVRAWRERGLTKAELQQPNRAWGGGPDAGAVIRTKP